MGWVTSLEFGQKLGQPPNKDPLHLQTLFSWSQEGRKWEVLLYHFEKNWKYLLYFLGMPFQTE